jgi:purine-binding chemotaxis protein CheW
MESADLGKGEMGSVEEEIQLVTFKLGKEEFGFDILKVREINKMMSMTRVPGAPDFMEGIMNLRGHVIPVINLRSLMGMESREYNRETSIVVIDIPGKTYGFIVDAVKEVLRIPVTVTEPPPVLTAGTESGFVTSIAKLDDRLLFLLDIQKITAFDVASEELKIN